VAVRILQRSKIDKFNQWGAHHMAGEKKDKKKKRDDCNGVKLGRRLCIDVMSTSAKVA